MSSPLSNLKKGKKVPLTTRTAPYKPTTISEDELISQLNLERKINAVKRYENGEKLSESTLVSSMIGRLSDVEKKLVEYEQNIKEKDKAMKILEDKCSIYKRAQGYGSDQIEELQKKCHKLQNQVHSMENFLEDYGMIWVGNPNSSDEEDEDDEDDIHIHSAPDEEKNELSNNKHGNLYAGKKLWKPECSLSSPRTFKIDFDLVLKNIKELNTISGEGEHYIKHTKDGARLQIKEPVPLILYANGIFMFGGPFRPYEDHFTQACVQDLMDGYFPGELQTSYPDGVPFNVDDKRDTTFKDKRLEILFPGQGQTLSPEKRKDENVPDFSKTTNSSRSRNIETIDNIVHKQSVDRFLSRLPPSVIKNGRVIDIREGLKDALKCEPSKNEVIVVETEVVKGIKERANSASRCRPSTASAVTTLRIKSESGDQTFMLKMKYTDTILDVKNHLDKRRDDDQSSYVLKTSFPNETYTDVRKSLKECGLIPNATLYIVKNVVT